MKKRQQILKKIPHFWASCFDAFGLFDIDEEGTAIQYLTDVSVERDEKDINHLKLTFAFESNSIFSNSTIVKEIWGSHSEGNFKAKNTEIKFKGKKQSEDEFLEWLKEEESERLVILANDLYPNAIELFLQDQNDEDVEDGSEDLEEESEDEPPKKRKK